jgi:hypothetical protein
MILARRMHKAITSFIFILAVFEWELRYTKELYPNHSNYAVVVVALIAIAIMTAAITF